MEACRTLFANAEQQLKRGAHECIPPRPLTIMVLTPAFIYASLVWSKLFGVAVCSIVLGGDANLASTGLTARVETSQLKLSSCPVLSTLPPHAALLLRVPVVESPRSIRSRLLIVVLTRAPRAVECRRGCWVDAA